MRKYLWVLLADVALLVALSYVVIDLQWRVSYAGSAHARTTGYLTSFSYSLFTQVFKMSGNGVSLTSPLTLDWVQVVAALLLILNGWFVYENYWKRHRGRAQAPKVPPVNNPTNLLG